MGVYDTRGNYLTRALMIRGSHCLGSILAVPYSRKPPCRVSGLKVYHESV